MALVSKILETTLTAGSTAVTFTDADIPNSLIRVFSSDSNIIPESRTLSGNSLTVTYAPQTNNIGVALEIVKQGLDIIDNVLSTDTDKALSAKQGYLLNAAIGDVSDNLDALTNTVNNLDIPDNISDLDDVTISNIQLGQVLAWDGTKFINVNQSQSSGINYSLNEQVVGTWINGKPLYQKTINFGALPDRTSKSVNHGISNIDYINLINITAQNSTTKDTLPIPFAHRSNINFSIQASVNSTAITIITAEVQSSYNKTYATLQYTKTTD